MQDILVPANKNEMQKLRATSGQLNWLVTQTRPELSYDALELDMSKHHPIVEQLLKATKASSNKYLLSQL